MTDPIRWGVLGASKFARTTMVPAIHASRGARVVALGTSSAEKGDPFRALIPDLRVVESYDDVLAADDVDAVYVPLPNSLHVEWTIKALEAGKHVLCEKPIAMDEDDFDRMIAARDTAGRLAAEAYMIVHHPQWQRARDLLAEGTIGRLRHVEGVFTAPILDPENVRNKAGMGGGGLRDLGVYPLGAVRFATGEEPEQLTAVTEIEKDFDTFAEVNARFPDFSYHAVISTRMALRQRMTFHGEGGIIEVTTPFNAGKFDQAELVIETSAAARTVERWPGVDQYILQVEAFGAAVRGEADYPWPLERARGTQVMIDAAIASGRAV